MGVSLGLGYVGRTEGGGKVWEVYVDSSLIRCARDFDRCYGLFGRTWSRG